ncbi:MAG: outer membrane beta-barrel protein [Acidobacteriaceae bacterium]|nr:outer membrane beta-barrel protein [Acidobacteriaceae bacterium]
MKLLVFAAIVALPLDAQFFSWGVKAGTPVTDSVVNSSSLISNSTTRFVIGPTAEIRIPVIGLGVEADALYRRYTIGSTISQWEFPVLLKYRFPGVILHPYVDAGPTWNHIGNPSLTGQIFHGSSSGFAFGGGVEVKALILRLSPELRYTHWTNQNLNLSTISSGLGSSQNQVEFLVGITF